MRKANSFLSVLVLFLSPVLEFGQGFLVDDRHDVSSRMPRPIWPHPATPRALKLLASFATTIIERVFQSG